MAISAVPSRRRRRGGRVSLPNTNRAREPTQTQNTDDARGAGRVEVTLFFGAADSSLTFIGSGLVGGSDDDVNHCEG